MRRRIRRYHLERVPAVREKVRVKGIELLVQLVLQQKPALLVVPTVVEGIDQVVIVIVMSIPAHANSVPVGRWRGRIIESRRRCAAGAWSRHYRSGRDLGRRLVAYARRHRDV